VWVTRDECEDSFYPVSIWKNKPEKQPYTGLWGGTTYNPECTPICSILVKEFKSLFGYTPRKGSIQEFKKATLE